MILRAEHTQQRQRLRDFDGTIDSAGSGHLVVGGEIIRRHEPETDAYEDETRRDERSHWNPVRGEVPEVVQ